MEPQLKTSDIFKCYINGEEIQDMGPIVTSPTDKSGSTAGKKLKETSGDAAQKKKVNLILWTHQMMKRKESC